MRRGVTTCSPCGEGKHLPEPPQVSRDPGTYRGMFRAYQSSFREVLHQMIQILIQISILEDEIATETRTRWEHKTNHFLGVCSVHWIITIWSLATKVEKCSRSFHMETGNQMVHIWRNRGIPELSTHLKLVLSGLCVGYG